MSFILASKSPRRRELLKYLDIDFISISPSLDEDLISKEILSNTSYDTFTLASKLTEKLSLEKAKKVLKDNPNNIVIASDTVVVSEEEILGKPKSKEEAYEMLTYLCGKSHRVYTGVSILSNNICENFSCYTEVFFWEKSPEIISLIEKYIETGSPLDKAGAYGIQDMGSLLVEKIHGDYFNVVGLPISLLNQYLVRLKLK